MELVGVNRNGEDQFVARCETHNWYYNGRPPITHGCRECWHVYYFSQWAMSKGDKKENLERLESAIHHAAETIDKGQWDYKPDLHPEIKIEHEPD